MAAIEAAMSPEDIAYLESAVSFFAVPEFNVLVVHGGVLPAWTKDACSRRTRTSCPDCSGSGTSPGR
jgi:hypothetical protein